MTENASNKPAGDGQDGSGAITVLLVEDEITIRNALEKALRSGNFWVRTVGTGREALEAIEDRAIEVALVDTRLPDAEGAGLIASIKEARPDIEIIVMAVMGMIDQAMEAIEKGATDFLRKPFERMELVTLAAQNACERRRLKNRIDYLESTLAERKSSGAIAGTSLASKALISDIKRLALNDAHVCIIGEPGTGKELAANVIHNSGPRTKDKLVTVECENLDKETAADEIFGKIKSSPTGVVQSRSSFFRDAEKGTLLLKEISALPLDLQREIAEALKKGEFCPRGSSLAVKIKTRVIVTNSKDMKKLAREGMVHPDLNVAFSEHINVPPLRDRPDDISEIAVELLNRLKNEGIETSTEGIDPSAIRLLEQYMWPQNISELKGVIRRAALIATEKLIQTEDLPKTVRGETESRDKTPLSLEAYEKLCYERALKEAGGDPRQAARLLGVGKSTVYRKIQEYNIDLKRLS